MAWYDYLNPWAYLGNRQPIELNATTAPVVVPKVAPPSKDGEAHTGSQQQVAGGVSAVQVWSQTCDPVPPGDYPVWRAMDADSALTLSRAVITAPIREADKSYEAREGTPDAWVQLIRDSIDPLWPEFIREALDSLSMGWKPYEPVFGRRDGRTILADLKPLAQELTQVLVRDGVFFGLRNQSGRDGKSIDLSAASSLVVTIDCKNRDPYGRPWHENCRRAWWDKLRCLRALAKLNDKASGIQGKVKYPPAADEATNHTNETKAKSLLASYMAGDGAVMPNAVGSLTPDMAADYRNIQGMAEAALWSLEIEDHGNTGSQTTAILDDLRFQNAELSRGWHVPERAAQEAVTAGSRADSETHTDVSLKVCQLVYNDICDALSRGPVDTMLVENFGERARGSVKVAAGRLRDVFAAGDWDLINAMVLQPELAFALFEQVDMDAVVVRRGIPLLKDSLSMADAIKKAVANRDKLQQAMVDAKRQLPNPVNGANGFANGNGKGRLAMARGVAWLGNLLGDEDHDGD